MPYKYRLWWFDGRMEESEETFETKEHATKHAEWRLANVPVQYIIIELPSGKSVGWGGE